MQTAVKLPLLQSLGDRSTTWATAASVYMDEKESAPPPTPHPILLAPN